jgi:uncharacterized membrane protein
MKLFGNQLQYTLEVFNARTNPVDMGKKTMQEQKHRLELHKEYSRVIMQIVLSIIVIVASFLLLFYYEEGNLHKLASGLIGTVIGYWLR